ncbi:MAG TPA: nitric oxide reductase, partial [Azonexus sp.]|nr:nitric oxide reductase [Azonexus sp.]
MEEFVGKLWHNWVTKTAGGHYPEAVVKLAEVEKTVGILFRALGGDPGLKVAAATGEAHGARRKWLQRIAGSGEKQALARRDAETLRLPPEITAFPEKSLNRDLYLWLAAIAASDVVPNAPWFIRNQRASQAALATFPGLRSRYERLVAAHISGRIAPEQLQPDEAAQELAIRQALRQPTTVDGLPPLNSRKSRPPQPVLLWLIAAETLIAGKLADPDEHLPPEGSGSGETEKQAHKAEQVETPDNQAPMLVMFRAESLPTWAEYVKVNRAYDDEEDPNAKNVANDL